MTEDKTNSGEADRTIPVTTEDCDNVRNYSLHFGVEITDTLQKAMDVFEKDVTYENMLDFKRELCNWLTSCGHESFQDPLWEHPTQASKDILYDLQFDKDVQEILEEKGSEALVETLHSEMIDAVKKHVKENEVIPGFTQSTIDSIKSSYDESEKKD